MLDFIHRIKDRGRHRMPRQGLKGRCPNEVQRSLGRNHANIIAMLSEIADKMARLVGGNSSRHSDEDAPPLSRPRPCGLWMIHGATFLSFLEMLYVLHSDDVTQDALNPPSILADTWVGSVQNVL